MHPALRPYYDHVIPVFWPWLWLNLVRVALWHLRTGKDALMAVDCFGNIRMVHLEDAPKPDDLYTYEAPLMPRWECPALGSDFPISAPAVGYRVFIASLSGVYAVVYVVRERMRGPPVQHPPPSFDFAQAVEDKKSHGDFPEKAQAQAQGIEARARAHKIHHTTGRQPPRRAFVLATA